MIYDWDSGVATESVLSVLALVALEALGTISASGIAHYRYPL